ncbi:polysaccharide deacetylase family protein [Maritimibacter sp. HL-12]|jgi:peptidoglycan/xylan/chitin deacetylase (PgdA/CDA1 family)|uniref:polysaccharide deacetylase family protein n=1 Tax=Maritimibacter sp. HL-12 TaxID=1162418 RepID=UPI000A0F3473|nr:polysaccharide deacetylase family protein [Maritimibacter sp. HL-12]SMH36283.1 Predicted xylanase/chitin deacetylase [Maritimibacter sp. HL-12]
MNGLERFFACLLLAVSLPLAASAQEAPRGLLSITFDDASRSQYKHGLRIAKDYDIVGTLFVITSEADGSQRDPNSWFMNWREVRAFRAAGWEIGSHSDTHPHLTQLPTADIIRELDVSREAIEAYVGVRPVSFASPYGDHDARTVGLVTERFSNHLLAWGGTEGRNHPATTDRAMISRMNVNWNTPPEHYCAEIRAAAANGIWLVLMFHQIVESDPEPYTLALNDFEEIMSCAAEARDAGAIRIETVRDAMALISRR